MNSGVYACSAHGAGVPPSEEEARTRHAHAQMRGAAVDEGSAAGGLHAHHTLRELLLRTQSRGRLQREEGEDGEETGAARLREEREQERRMRIGERKRGKEKDKRSRRKKDEARRAGKGKERVEGTCESQILVPLFVFRMDTRVAVHNAHTPVLHWDGHRGRRRRGGPPEQTRWAV